MELGTILRYIAPFILVAMLVTTVVVIATSVGGDKEAKSSESQAATPETRRKRERRRARARQTTYTVEPGDSLAIIETKTKVSREDLVRFNPTLDPQALQPGEKLKLR